MRIVSGFVSPFASAQANLNGVMTPRNGGTSSPQIACAGSGFPRGTLDGPPNYIKVTSASGQVAEVRVFGMGMVTRFGSEQKVRGSTEARTATVQDWTRSLSAAVKLEIAKSKKPDYFEGPAAPRLAEFPSALEKAAQIAAAKNLAVFVDGYSNIYIGTAKGTGDNSKITVLGQVKYDDGKGNPQAPTLVRKGAEGYKEPMHGLRGGCGIETAKAGRAGDTQVAQGIPKRLPFDPRQGPPPQGPFSAGNSGSSTHGTPGRALNGKILRPRDPDQI